LSQWEVRLALPSDKDQILNLQSIPMMDSIQLSITYHIKPEDRVVLVLRDHKLMGMGVRSRSQHRWDNDSHWIRVLKSMRSASSFLPRHTLLEVYRLIRAAPAINDPTWELTSILEGNLLARRLLEAGLRGLPKYSPLVRMSTFTFKSNRRTSKPSPGIGNVEVIESSEYRCRIERVQGRKTIICGYSPTLKFFRPMINPILKIRGVPALPPSGTELKEAFIVNSQWKPGDRKSLKALTSEIQEKAVNIGAEFIHWGIPSDHPDLFWLKSRLKAWETRSIVYAVHDLDINPPRLKNFWPEVSHL